MLRFLSPLVARRSGRVCRPWPRKSEDKLLWPAEFYLDACLSCWKQLAEFNTEEKDLLGSISALKSAITVRSKHRSSMLQIPGAHVLGIAPPRRSAAWPPLLCRRRRTDSTPLPPSSSPKCRSTVDRRQRDTRALQSPERTLASERHVERRRRASRRTSTAMSVMTIVISSCRDVRATITTIRVNNIKHWIDVFQKTTIRPDLKQDAAEVSSCACVLQETLAELRGKRGECGSRACGRGTQRASWVGTLSCATRCTRGTSTSWRCRS